MAPQPGEEIVYDKSGQLLTASLGDYVIPAASELPAIETIHLETAHDGDWVEANREKLVRLYPLRRLGQAQDVAPMVAMLAFRHAGWITGQVLSISGGYSMV